MNVTIPFRRVSGAAYPRVEVGGGGDTVGCPGNLKCCYSTTAKAPWQGPAHWTGAGKSDTIFPIQKGNGYGGANYKQSVAAGHPPGGEPAEKPEQLSHYGRAEPADRHRLPGAGLSGGHGAPAGGDRRGPGPAGHLSDPSPQRPHGPCPGADPPWWPDFYRKDRRGQDGGLSGPGGLAGHVHGVPGRGILPGGDGSSLEQQSRPKRGTGALWGLCVSGGRGYPDLWRPHPAVCWATI